MKKYIKPILLIVIYMIMQGIAGGVMAGILLITNADYAGAVKAGDAAKLAAAIPASCLAMSIMVSGILTVIIASVMKLINWKTVFSWDKEQASRAWLPLVAALAGIFAITVLEEQLQLEDNLEEQFASMMHSTIGILSISLVGPIVEEFCFREALMGGMLRKGMKPWMAIGLSAAIFGLVHANPVQIFGAALIGIILGIIYYKSGNIILTSILHIFNNSLATFLAVTFGMDATLSDVMGGTTICIVSGILCAVISIALFVRYWKCTESSFEVQE